MSFASNAGRGLGKVVGWTAATAVKSVVFAAEATGEFGEAAYESAVESYDARAEQMDRNAEARKAKYAALKAARLAGAQTTAVIEVVPA